ncbi:MULTISPECIES: hypothetical protein [Sphingobacterium]|uniref:Uncharacterized protein n=1 Tax=Sphingobacterium thermophilum TaxID=768534 RepID=A0ABP8QXH7_9SPHI|nr:hypothetical protein [Sphingobacterium sp. T2]
MEVLAPKDCNNAPKKRIIKEFTEALWSQQWSVLRAMVVETFTFEVAGKLQSFDFAALQHEIPSNHSFYKMELDAVITHGAFGACQGKIQSKVLCLDFAFFLSFTSAGKNTIKHLKVHLSSAY